MGSRVIVCALSPLKSDAAMENYSCSMAGGGTYAGRQTNEAPITCLMDLAMRDDATAPVTTIVYLRSSRCEGPIEDLGGLTTEEYFLRYVKAYATSQSPAIPIPTCRPIPFEPNDDMSEALRLLIDEIEHANDGRGVTVDIDTTGGPRDAMTLVALAVQVIKMGGEHGGVDVTLGRIVYSSRFEGKNRIISQNDTYEIVDLVNAIDTFLSHGKAELLSVFFDGRHRACSGKLRDAVGSMRLFSDALALCRANDAYRQIPRIRGFLQQLANDERDGSDVQLTHSERLFRALVPAMQRGIFAPDAGDGAEDVIAVIRWCVERGMLQQALALYEEKIPDYMGARGILPCVPRQSKQLVKAVLWLGECSGRRGRDEREDVLQSGSLNPSQVLRNPVSCIRSEFFDGYRHAFGRSWSGTFESSLFSPAMQWYFYITRIRNSVMHADDMSARLRERVTRSFRDFFRASGSAARYVSLVERPHPNATELNVAVAHDLRHSLNLLCAEPPKVTEETPQGLRVLDAASAEAPHIGGNKDAAAYLRARDFCLARAEPLGEDLFVTYVPVEWAHAHGPSKKTLGIAKVKGMSVPKAIARAFPHTFAYVGT